MIYEPISGVLVDDAAIVFVGIDVYGRVKGCLSTCRLAFGDTHVMVYIDDSADDGCAKHLTSLYYQEDMLALEAGTFGALPLLPLDMEECAFVDQVLTQVCL